MQAHMLMQLLFMRFAIKRYSAISEMITPGNTRKHAHRPLFYSYTYYTSLFVTTLSVTRVSKGVRSTILQQLSIRVDTLSYDHAVTISWLMVGLTIQKERRLDNAIWAD